MIAAGDAPGLVFVSHGSVVGVHCPDPRVLARLGAELPTGARLAGPAAPDALYTWTVRRDGRGARHCVRVRCRRYERARHIAHTRSLDEALRLLVHDAEFRIAMYAPDDVFVHAATVEWRGRAIVVPGESFAGKSTLAAALVRAGARYGSDEYAVLAPDGRVAPFGRRLMLRDAGGRHVARPRAEELGGAPMTAPAPLGALLLTRWVAGAHWMPRPASRGTAMLALLRHAIDVRARPGLALERVARAMRAGPLVLAGERGDADDTAARLLAHLDSCWA